MTAATSSAGKTLSTQAHRLGAYPQLPPALPALPRGRGIRGLSRRTQPRRNQAGHGQHCPALQADHDSHTAGEPLLRPDIYEIITYAKSLELKPVLATCGTTLTQEVASRLKAAGIERISVSLDGPDAASHDAFRGVPGAFEGSMKGLEAAT